MLIADIGTVMAYVDVERSRARKVRYNARGAIGLRCNLNLRHYYKTHCRTVKLRKQMSSVFHNSSGAEYGSGLSVRSHKPRIAGSNPASATKSHSFFVKKISTYIMLSFITDITNPILEYIKDDPVRPELPKEFRVAKNRFVSALVEDAPQAIVCVSLHDFVPTAVDDLNKDTEQPTTAIFYTIWSYVPGAGTTLLRETVEAIRSQFPSVNRFVTLSPKTEMARKFHLKNGAMIFRENENTVNYEYLIV